MSDYDSGDKLLDDVSVDALLANSKRSMSPGGGSNSRKRTKLGDGTSQDGDHHSIIAKSILKEKFGFDDFRHEQSDAINAVLQGNNSLVIFPTGAGKSLCYQIPGIAFEKIDASSHTENRPGAANAGSGITIVVSPLIALMKDQVDALVRRDIPAACLDSTKTWEEQKEISAGMREGRLRLLYCAPERLNNEGFVESMKYIPGGIRLVAVDEAHCISEWGHSFRPDYLKIARFVQEIQAERVICLTATATPLVAKDICEAFQITDENVFRTPPYRPNLQLLAEAVDTRSEKFPRLVKFLNEHPGPTLVYVTFQKQSEDIARRLSAEKFSVAAFHAGLKTEEKTEIQDKFMAGEIRIVVATIAFGMGIDKADIRNVLHYDISSSVEEYSQQIGRAGRDGKQSYCMMYLCNDDFGIRENFARGDLPSRASLRQLLDEIFNEKPLPLPDGGEVLKLNQGTLSRDYDIRISPLSILLATLELRFGLIRAITPEYSTYQFEAMPAYDAAAQDDSSPEAMAIAQGATKAIKFHRIDVDATAQSAGLQRADIIRKLNALHDTGLIRLRASGVVNRFKVLGPLPQTDDEIASLVDKLHAEMESREQDALRRTQQVADLFTATSTSTATTPAKPGGGGGQCFARSLAEHFGTSLPPPSPEKGAKERIENGTPKTACGHCTYCLTGGRAIALPPRPAPPVDLDGIRRVLEACDVRDDPRFLTRVAFGIKSPRVTRLRLDKTPVFGSLEDHDFPSLLKEFTIACESG
ncbi:P-loop containing nucleoside triphosphate hydrolase protein [Biscogniauxia marginata]|nr:P-loop containing nucleoside triphosphate hydrolase protein [Biscogniauxia marginata]